MMADRTNFFYRQRVQEAELDIAFELLEQADRNLASDLGIYGIIAGAKPAPHSPVPDLSIDVTAPGRAYDRLGRRIFIATQQVVDCAVDELGLPTAVTTEAHGRWLSVSVRFDRALTDLRTDGHAQDVFFRQDESFSFVVRQAPESPMASIQRVPFAPDELLVADIWLQHGQTQIQAEHIDTTRRQVFVFSSSQAISVTTEAWKELQPEAATVQSSLDAVDGVLSTVRADISARIQTILDQTQAIVQNLMAHPGQEGTPQATAPNHSLPPSSIQEAITFLLGEVNKRLTRVGDTIQSLHVGEAPVDTAPNTLTVGDQDFGLVGTTNPELKFGPNSVLSYIRTLGRFVFVNRGNEIFTLYSKDGGVGIAASSRDFLEDTLQGTKLLNGLHIVRRPRNVEPTLIVDENRTNGAPGIDVRSAPETGKALKLTHPSTQKNTRYAQIHIEPLQGRTSQGFPTEEVKAGDVFCSGHTPARLYFYNGSKWVQLG